MIVLSAICPQNILGELFVANWSFGVGIGDSIMQTSNGKLMEERDDGRRAL